MSRSGRQIRPHIAVQSDHTPAIDLLSNPSAGRKVRNRTLKSRGLRKHVGRRHCQNHRAHCAPSSPADRTVRHPVHSRHHSLSFQTVPFGNFERTLRPLRPIPARAACDDIIAPSRGSQAPSCGRKNKGHKRHTPPIPTDSTHAAAIPCRSTFYCKPALACTAHTASTIPSCSSSCDRASASAPSARRTSCSSPACTARALPQNLIHRRSRQKHRFHRLQRLNVKLVAHGAQRRRQSQHRARPGQAAHQLASRLARSVARAVPFTIRYTPSAASPKENKRSPHSNLRRSPAGVSARANSLSRTAR